MTKAGLSLKAIGSYNDAANDQNVDNSIDRILQKTSKLDLPGREHFENVRTSAVFFEERLQLRMLSQEEPSGPDQSVDLVLFEVKGRRQVFQEGLFGFI